MTKREINNEYFRWILNLLSSEKRAITKYRKLLYQLHDINFRYSIPLDANREDDGIQLRYRFGYEKNYDQREIARYLDDRPCSVLEMIVALAIRFEEHIVGNPEIGNRTSDWFWEMLDNLGLSEFEGAYYNSDMETIDYIVDRFLDRDYERNGEGGLFIIPNCQYDMRSSEIWYQMQWYFDYKFNK